MLDELHIIITILEIRKHNSNHTLIKFHLSTMDETIFHVSISCLIFIKHHTYLDEGQTIKRPTWGATRPKAGPL